jgi:hypothetical protein
MPKYQYAAHQLDTSGPLITIMAKNQCLGHLMDFNDRGVFSPDGKVEVDPDKVQEHNETLDQVLIEGLDKNCAVGQGGMFYYDKIKNVVNTFTGQEVSGRVKVAGKVITFTRKAKVFRGRLSNDSECFTFRRIE